MNQDKLNSIPEALKQIPQWVVRKDKMPINPKTGAAAKAGDPDTWASFATAVQALDKSNYSGLGFEFHNNGIVGVDLDSVRDPNTGEIAPEAKEIISQLNSYTELSPSGYGFHIICKADVALNWNKAPLPSNGIRRPDIDPKTNQQKKNSDGSLKFKQPEIEMYNHGRYFTITGDSYNSLSEVSDRTGEVESLHTSYFKKEDNSIMGKPALDNSIMGNQASPQPLAAAEKDYLAIGLDKDDKLKALWNGDSPTSDKSRDDLSLMNKLAYWCNCDESSMIEAFKSSPYFLQKDPEHIKKANRKDYLPRTAKKAIEDCRSTAESTDKGFKYPQAKDDFGEICAEDVSEISPYAELLNGSDYIYKSNNLYLKVKKDDEEYVKWLANFMIVAESETVRDNGIECTLTFKLKAIYRGVELHSAYIPAKDFNSSMGFITQTWGLKLRTAIGFNTMKYISDSISVQAEGIKQEHIYTHTGWRKCGDKWAFLHAGGAIALTEFDRMKVELDGRLSQYDMSSDEIPDFNIVRELLKLAPKEIIFPLVAVAFLSPLNEFMRQAGVEPSFVLFLLGSTGVWKSSLAALILCFFGKFGNKTLPESFKDTTNSLEKQGFLLKDVLTVIDDYHPTGSRQEAQKMQATAQAIARMYGDRNGRGRMGADTNLKTSYIPRGNAIVTGEDLPDIGESGIARNIIITVERGVVKKDDFLRLDRDSAKLSACMTAYIKWLIPQADSLPSLIKQHFLALRAAAGNPKRHDRTAENVAHLQIGMTYFIKFMQDSGAFTKDQAEEMRQISWKTFIEIADKQNQQLESEKPTVLFISAFEEMLSTGVIHVMEVDTPFSDCFNHSPGFVGYQDNDYYYLHADTVFTHVFRFYRDQEKNFPVKKNALLKQLATQQLIYFEGSANTVQKKVRGKKEKLLWLKKGKSQPDSTQQESN